MSKDDKKLESFKIGDTQKPGITKGKVSDDAKRQEESEANSLGFRRIETILENDDALAVSENLNKLLLSLEEFQKNATSNREKAAVKKAIIAVERTADLLDYLFQTKVHLQTTP
ncbi:hypothetical protein ACFL6C_06965 [Myxococcota bacterium]